MSTENASLLPEVVACRNLVEDYTKRLDDACEEYYETGKTEFPKLSRAEDEDTGQQCERLLTRLVSIMPDVMTRWQSIKYPIDQYEQMVERMRAVWVHRRNLFRAVESTLRTNLELDSRSRSVVSGKEPSANLAPSLSKKIFIVHGHGGELKEAAARLVAQLQFEPVILHEQPTGGRTIIEQFSVYAKDAGFALALLTADDVGAAGTVQTHADLQPRARQNVVFELGFFFGSLGRGKVCAVYERGLEMPSDLGGILYVPYDATGEWRWKVAKEIREAGYPVDLNRL